MKSYTLRNLSMDVCYEKFILPFDKDEKDDTIIEKTIKLISDADIYERNLLTDRDENDKIAVNEYGEIRAKCLYESYEGYIPFNIVMEVFRFDTKQDPPKYNPNSFYTFDGGLHKPHFLYYLDDNGEKIEVKNGQLMVVLWLEHEEGCLLDELLDLKVMPSIIEKLKLKKYNYN